MKDTIIYCKNCKHIGTKGRYTQTKDVLCQKNPKRTPSFHRLEAEHFKCSLKNATNECTDFEYGWSFSKRFECGAIAIFLSLLGAIILAGAWN